MNGMNFELPSVTINPNDYDEIISLGTKCPTAMILRDLKIYKESYPFDYITTTPKLILKYMKDQNEFYPKKGEIGTKDLVSFAHFNVTNKYEETIETFKRRFVRLFTVLKDHKRILFVYTNEAGIYNTMGNRYNDNYGDLIELQDYIKNTYKYDNFTIMAVHVNKIYSNTSNIINFNTLVDNRYLSDNRETHTPEVYNKYRKILSSLLKLILVTS